MNVIILGANGQLGYDLVKVLVGNLDRSFNIVGISRIQFDASYDMYKIEEKLLKYSPNIIINCIALTNVDWCETNSQQALQINSDFVYHLAQFCNNYRVILMHISTDYVFDGIKETAYKEHDQTAPQNIYGLSKYLAEGIITAYHDRSFIFRVSGLFGKQGASGKGGNFITTIQRLIQEKDKIDVIVDQVSNPTSTIAIARCILHFIMHKVNDYGLYHCVSNDSCSWYDFAREIALLSHLDADKISPIEFKDYKFKVHRPQNSVLSIDKLSHYYSMPSWRESLIEYFSE